MLETAAKPFLKICDCADPLSWTNGIGNVFHPVVGCAVICIGEYDISADDLLSGENRGQKIRSAKEFLKEVLESGFVAQTKVAEEAESRGIKKKTLWNAKKELEIDSVKIGNQWFWMLPE